MALRPLPPKPKPGARPQPGKPPTKTFTIEKWDGSTSGEKIIIYADHGMGKSTLASMAPNPVFIGLDDGGRKLRHPQTGELLNHIPGVETFEDVRAALDACLDLDCETVVIDTITELELLGEPYTFKTVPGPKGSTVKNLEGYGYGKGHKHLYDTMRLPLLNCDKLVAAGKNVIAIAQLGCNKRTNDIGEEYLKEGPQLYHSEKGTSILNLWGRWADHIFRITTQSVVVPDGKKKAVGDVTRIINTVGGLSYEAKSRTLDDPVISFATKDDDSLWQMLFGGEEDGS
jgi:hypothetical protein